MMRFILVLITMAVLSIGCGCTMVEVTPKEEPQKICVDSTGRFFYECYTGKLIADDAYRR